MLAKQAGFSESEARTISKANEAIDYGKTDPLTIVGGKDIRKQYHGFEADREQARLDALAAGDLTTLGARLHHFQDTFSHENFGAQFGHAFLLNPHAPDKMSNAPEKAVKAALGTFEILSKKAAELGKKGFGAPDQNLLMTLAKADANVTDYDPKTKTLSIEVGKGDALSVAKDLAGQGYKVAIDGVPYNY